MSNEKERLSLRVSPVISYRLHTAYRKSGCRSMNELAEKAIDSTWIIWKRPTPAIFSRRR